MRRTYWLLVAVMLGAPPASGGGGELLPDLTPLPGETVRIETGAYTTDLPGPSAPRGCYADERLSGARRCLRYDLVVANVGDGPFELRFRLDGAASRDTRDVVQRVFRSDGGYVDLVADTYRFHPTHAHFHYERFAQAHLWRSSEAGERLDATPVRSGPKVGFCMIDMERRYGTQRRTYNSPRCRAPTIVDPDTGEVSIVNGISVGWADVYHWYLGDQYIEISGIRDGFYLLQTVIDPEGTIAEIDDVNNSAEALIEIRDGNAARIIDDGG